MSHNFISYQHENISKHYDELKVYLNTLDFEFYFMGLSENWLDDNKD